MSHTIHIPVVLGTARAERASAQVAHAVVDLIATHEGYSAELVDVKDHVTHAVTIPPWADNGADASGSAWKDIVENADALVLVVPEYNHSFPGELKLLLDSLFKHYSGLPVALVGVSTGTFGGARVVEHMQPLLHALGMIVIKESVLVSDVSHAFTAAGNLANERTVAALVKMLTALGAMAQVTKSLRPRAD